jgi:hypothetical protein
MKDKPNPPITEDASGEHPDRDREPSKTTILIPQTGLAPAGVVKALQLVGTGLPALVLPIGGRSHNLGSADHPDIHLRVSSRTARGDMQAPESVSRFHLQVQRKGSHLWIRDKGSMNGTFIKGRREREGAIAAGETFRVGDVTLLAMDDQMRLLRPTLRWVLGFDAHAYVDEMLEVIATGDPLLLIGPAACEQRYLAEEIHNMSARRAFGFSPIVLPVPERDKVDGLAATPPGTVYLDLAEHPRLPAWFVAHLFGGTCRVRPIIASPRVEDAMLCLGEHNLPKLRVIDIPAIKERAHDVPGILDSLFRRPPLESERELVALGESRLERLKEFDWPDNFDDLRRNAPKILAYIEAGFIMREAARKLGLSHQALGASLHRIGL